MRGAISMSVIYGFIMAVSFLVALGYLFYVKKKEKWLIYIYFAVVVVNTGYFVLSVARTLNGALWANRIAYLGSVFLPLFMLLLIMEVCQMEYSRGFCRCLVGISVGVFCLAASGGYLDVYYKAVSLIHVNGAVRLVKEYGPLHSLYLIYLLAYFGGLVGIILYSSLKKKATSHKLAVFLASIVLGNVGIWFVEQLIAVDFEFLSVSYVITELLLLLLYSMLADGTLAMQLEEDPVREMVPVDSQMGENSPECDELELLTSRELEVLELLLEDVKRKEIADRLGVSENTVKKHTSHIFSKLEVSNRRELMEKVGDARPVRE